jgi:hypothetical protein
MLGAPQSRYRRLALLSAHARASVLVAPIGSVRASSAAIIAAFFAYELVLYITGFGLPGGDEAFTLPIVLRIAVLNIGAFAILLTAHRLEVAGGLLCRNIVEDRAASMPIPTLR